MNRAFLKMFATNTDRCPVHFFKAYISHHPECATTPESPFYLGIKHKQPSEAKIWYINSPTGINTLGKFMTTASTAVGIDRTRVTNHSVRTTMIQRLVNSKFTPKEVAQLSGHKNLKSLDSYMTASEDTHKNMSLSLGKSNAISTSSY